MGLVSDIAEMAALRAQLAEIAKASGWEADGQPVALGDYVAGLRLALDDANREIARLTIRVDDLLRANNDELERRRAEARRADIAENVAQALAQQAGRRATGQALGLEDDL